MIDKRVFLALLTLGSVHSAFGQIVDARANGSQLIINEVVVAQLRTARGTQLPSQRAAAAALTLSDFQAGQYIEILPPSPPSEDWGIMLGQRRIITVTPEEAKAANSSPRALAERWGQNIQQALSLPGLQIDQTSITLAPDKDASVTLTGALARKAILGQNPPGLVSVSRVTGRLTVKPLKLGRGVLTVVNGKEIQQIQVAILPYAMKFPVETRASVMGEPAQSSTVMSAVRAALGRVKLPPNGRLTVRQIPETELSSGQAKTLTVAVRAEAPNTFPVDGEVTVRISNIGLMPRNESQLWYSNSPENVDGPQRLYWGKLNPGQTIRLLAHHKNVTSKPLDVCFSMVNPSDSPIPLSLTMGDSRPDLNPTLAGYIAGDAFMRSWMSRSGEVVVIPPRSAMPLIIRRVNAEETMSALAVLANKASASSALTLISEALPAGGLPPAWASAGSFPAPWTKLPSIDPTEEGIQIAGSAKHVYSPPLKEETFTNEAGGFTFVRIGENAIRAKVENSYEELLGNFGVHYRVAGTIKNTGKVNQKVEVVFEASAGYSGALFLVNGIYVPARILQAKQVVRLWTKTLAPGDVEKIVVQTIPLSGAHYPATLIIRPIDSIQ